MFSVVILFHHFFPLLEKVEIRVFILPRNFPAVLIIFTGRGREPLPSPQRGAGRGTPPSPRGGFPAGRGVHPWFAPTTLFYNYGLSQEVGLNFLGRAICQSYQRSQILFQRMCPYPYFLSRRLHHMQMREAVDTHKPVWRLCVTQEAVCPTCLTNYLPSASLKHLCSKSTPSTPWSNLVFSSLCP